MKIKNYFSVLLAMSLTAPTLASSKRGSTARNYAISIPLFSVARESKFGVQANFFDKGAVSVQWNRLHAGEDYRKSELEEDSNRSLLTAGQELSLMYNRYNDSSNMSGFYWGLGLGYQTMNAVWKRNRDLIEGAVETPAAETDEKGLIHNELRLSGTTYNGEIGYRYVFSSIGLSLGVNLKLRHFQSNIVEKEDNLDKLEAYQQESTDEDRQTLRRRFMSKIFLGPELGWTF